MTIICPKFGTPCWKQDAMAGLLMAMANGCINMAMLGIQLKSTKKQANWSWFHLNRLIPSKLCNPQLSLFLWFWNFLGQIHRVKSPISAEANVMFSIAPYCMRWMLPMAITSETIQARWWCKAKTIFIQESGKDARVRTVCIFLLVSLQLWLWLKLSLFLTHM